MYFIAGGATPGSGALYKVSEVSTGQVVTSELILSELTAPSGLTMDTAGNIYFTETLPFPDGKIRKIAANKAEARDYIQNLDYPTGVAIDTFNQLYVLENGQRRVLRHLATGAFETFADTEIGSPEVGTIDIRDNLYLLESEPTAVSRIDPRGGREMLTAPDANLRDMALDMSGIVHLLQVDVDSGLGKILRVTGDATEDVVVDLINPTAIAFDGANALYIAEGSPANRISRYAAGETVRRIIVTMNVEPNAIIFTPF